jgi:hypothetical protein
MPDHEDDTMRRTRLRSRIADPTPYHPGGGTPVHTAKLAASLLVMLALALGAAPAQAETVNCTAITTVPFVITTQGIYCFIGDVVTAITSGNAIDIQTNNVVVDLNGWKLGGLAAGLGATALGINALDRQNITIMNGTIRGFFRGSTWMMVAAACPRATTSKAFAPIRIRSAASRLGATPSSSKATKS